MITCSRFSLDKDAIALVKGPFGSDLDLAKPCHIARPNSSFTLEHYLIFFEERLPWL